jgi:hypothetical protein
MAVKLVTIGPVVRQSKYFGIKAVKTNACDFSGFEI